MSIHTQQSMTNHHVNGLWTSLNETLHTWIERHRTREELSHWSDRDLHDVGLSWSDIVHEAERPFWRA